MERFCSSCKNLLSEMNCAPSVLRIGGQCRDCRNKPNSPWKKAWDTYKRSVKGRYANLKGKAKKFGRNLEISFEEFEKLVLSNSCVYCGGKLDTQGYGLDRVNRSLGYTKENCVPCCGACNRRKGRLEGLGFSPERSIQLLKELNAGV